MELGLRLGLGAAVPVAAGDEEQPPVQLELGFVWPQEQARGFDVNRSPDVEEEEDDPSPEEISPASPNNSGTSSFPLDLSGGGGAAGEAERGSSRTSDEEENGLSRKKLRLSKEQSAFLEESFKEHSTLNPKQKMALAKQLNLRPRQVEVWFQNRRARTKLKQTEVDCEYLKRCCETLTEENRRLQKELTELRALKATSTHPFLSHLPATTLSMCPSCERVSSSSTSLAGKPPSTAGKSPSAASGSDGFSHPPRPRFFPFITHHQASSPTT